MNKNTYLSLSIICLLFAGFSVLYCYIPRSQSVTPVAIEAPLATYHNTVLGISFQYPEGEYGYTLTEVKTLSDNAELVKSLAFMTSREADVASGTPLEVPPIISVNMFKNPKNKDLAVWAGENKTFSNFGMKTDVPAEFMISGAKAIRYTSDGLYQSDNVIIANGGYIYVVTGAYADELSQTHKDFLGLIGSIEFATSTKANS
jgi:hypothetical protein